MRKQESVFEVVLMVVFLFLSIFPNLMKTIQSYQRTAIFSFQMPVDTMGYFYYRH
jgi:hypothetical protein